MAILLDDPLVSVCEREGFLRQQLDSWLPSQSLGATSAATRKTAVNTIH